MRKRKKGGGGTDNKEMGKVGKQGLKASGEAKKKKTKTGAWAWVSKNATKRERLCHGW